jgi:predicted nucleotidyltransferase
LLPQAVRGVSERGAADSLSHSTSALSALIRSPVLILSTIVLKMSTATPSIGDLLLGQTRGQILALLLGAPDESFFLRQIARQTNTSAGTARRELNLLADTGLIARSVLGSQVFYRANRDHPIFRELRALLAKTMGVFELLKNALAPLSSRINFAFVYGSVARGEDNAASDIDLMVVGAVSLDDILDALTPLEKQLRRPVNPTIYSLKDLKQRYRAGNHFLRSLKNTSKVFLIGAEDDFRKALATRMVQS